MSTQSCPTVTILGRGRLGTLLHTAFSQAGRNAGLLPGTTTGPVPGDVVILAVPDDALHRVAAAIAWAPGQVAVHCSGAQPVVVLDAARHAGARPACLHPAQTLRPGASPAVLQDAAAAIETDDDDAWLLLHDLARDLGLRPVRLDAAGRVHWHAACVLVSNYLVTLWHLAADELAAADVTDPGPVLAPLAAATLANLRQDHRGALTGPIARGDSGTIRRHLDTLLPATAPVYRALGTATLPFAPLSPDQRHALLAALDPGDRP